MAMNHNSERSELLDPFFTLLSGVVSAVLGLAGVVSLLVYLLSRTVSTEVGLYGALWVVLLFVVTAASAALFLGRIWASLFSVQVWAQRFLLIFWLLVVVPVLVLGAAAAALLILASGPGSRLRYGTFTIASIAAALAVVLVLNLIAHTDPIHKDVESLGQYGISKRTETVLQAVDQPLRITCVYTADEKKEFRPRVVEMLEEMRGRMKKLHKEMDVVNITTDAEKAKLLEHLRAQMGGQAGGHVSLLKGFDKRSELLLADLRSEMQTWDKLGEDSYLRLWGLPPDIQRMLASLIQDIEDLRLKVRREMAGSALTDYARLVQDVKDAVESTQKPLGQLDQVLGQIGKIPAEVAKNRQAALESVKKSTDAAKAMIQAAGAEKDPPPADPAKALQQFIAAANAAQEQLIETAKALENVAGSENSKLVRVSRSWIFTLAGGDKLYRIELGRVYQEMIAETIDSLKTEAQTYLSKAKAEAQADFIQKMRPALTQVGALLDQAGKAAGEAVDKLAKPDEPARKLFQRAEGGKFFDKVLKPLNSMLEDIKKLPEIKTDSLPTDIAQENVAIVEVAGKTKVISFEEMWPMKVRPFGMGSADEKGKRVFNGDSAISSKVLSMTQKPFATVLLTYLAPDPQMMQMMRMSPESMITPRILTTLRKRLEDANFEVGEWDLSQERPGAPLVCSSCGTEAKAAATTTRPERCEKCGGHSFESRPQVLIVLPPSPPMPPMQPGVPPPASLGPEHIEKIRQAMDSGLTAIFLAKYLPPMGFMAMPYPYAMNEYLTRDWGLEVRGDYRLVQGIPDDTVPGRFKIDVLGFNYLPLSAFTDHPIGKPLQAQRTLWSDVCPVRRALDEKGKPVQTEGVTVGPLLEVPPYRTDVWATRQVRDLVYKVQVQPDGFVSPSTDDIRSRPSDPLVVAWTATRDGDEKKNIKPSRIVVLGMGGSFFDGYLDQQVPVLGAKGEISFSAPPLVDADAASNGVYWLSGRDKYIAAGPVLFQPVNITRSARVTLWILCVVVLPMVVMAAGFLVLFLRRR